eukprot:11169707-Lingulodinium_polyedra.AAC.1
MRARGHGTAPRWADFSDQEPTPVSSEAGTLLAQPARRLPCRLTAAGRRALVAGRLQPAPTSSSTATLTSSASNT